MKHKYQVFVVISVWMVMAIGYYQEHQAVGEAWRSYDALVEAHKEEREEWATLYLTVTAYTPSSDECDSAPDTTAIMERPIPGRTCAVSRDLSHLLGKNVWVDGHGVFRVNDLMNSRYEKRLDIVVGSKSAAFKHGVRDKKVVVL